MYKPVLEQMGQDPLTVLAEKIRGTYLAEKAEDALELTRDESSLTVTVAYCPAVKHLHSIGREVSPWYRQTTEVVMQVLAKTAGVSFTMAAYDEETGAAEYRFE